MNLENNHIQNKKIICLVGMMGVGKTTIGRKLAEILDYYYFDSDVEISDFTKKSIAQIFEEDGEEYFRNIESDIVSNLIHRKEKMVISLGGGAFINNNIRDILLKNSTTIWLDANIDTIIARTKNTKDRPKLTKSRNKRRFLTDLLNKRNAIYKKANIKIDANINDCKNIIDDIIQKLS